MNQELLRELAEIEDQVVGGVAAGVMTMSVRAKFKCVSREPLEGESQNIRLEAVIDDSEENKSFFRWTMGCVNPSASSQFVPGKEYYIDFTLAE